MRGLILKGISGFYYVKSGDCLIQCQAKGRFRNENIRPVAGDVVEFEINEDNTGVITKIYDRKNFFIRPPVANIDRGFIVLAQKTPEPSFLFIDKAAAVFRLKEIEPIIIINKRDLDDSDYIYNVYKNSGFLVYKISTFLDDVEKILAPLIKDKVCAFVGVSGVGKSSIINALDSNFKIEVGDVSEKTKRGRHTTRHVELIKYAGGYVVDTPGFSLLDLKDSVKKDQLDFAFMEFAAYKDKCRFVDCVHINQAGCAVIEALKNKLIEQSRYASYVEIYNQIKDVKDWE